MRVLALAPQLVERSAVQDLDVQLHTGMISGSHGRRRESFCKPCTRLPPCRTLLSQSMPCAGCAREVPCHMKYTYVCAMVSRFRARVRRRVRPRWFLRTGVKQAAYRRAGERVLRRAARTRDTASRSLFAGQWPSHHGVNTGGADTPLANREPLCISCHQNTLSYGG